MRTLAALFAILAVTVWRVPFPVFAQSVLLAVLAVICLAFRRAAAVSAGPQARSEP